MLPEMIHLSFQAFFSFRNFASPGCTGTVGLALMPLACMPMKSRARGSKPGSALARLFPLIVERVQHLVDDLLGHIRTHVVAEQERHAQDRLHADVLAEYLFWIDLHGSEVRRRQLLDLIRTRD